MFIGRNMYTCASVAGTYDGHIGLKPHDPSLGLNVKVNHFYTSRLKTGMGEFLINFSINKIMLKSQHSVFDSSYITFWKRQNYGDNKKISGFQGLQRRRNE